eukprot:SAG11_NODE_21962_length_415_cov_0.648734_1_plen_105_part_10
MIIVLAQMIGPIMTGYLAQHYGIAFAFGSTAIVTAVAQCASRLPRDTALWQTEGVQLGCSEPSWFGGAATAARHSTANPLNPALCGPGTNQSTILYFTRLSGFGE